MENGTNTTTTAQQPTTPLVDQVEGFTSVAAPQSPKKSIFSRFPHAKIVLVVIVLLILVIIAIILYTVLRGKQSPKAQVPVSASSELGNVLLATVGNKKIYESDVKKIALEQYQQPAINGSVMKMFLETAEERAILDQEAVALGITLVPDAEKNEAYYTKIKNAIINSKISSINATQIGWWIPPPNDYPQLPLYDIQRSDGEKAVLDIETQLTQNMPVIQILKNAYQKYPSLQSVLSINGARYTGQTSIDGLSITREYQYDTQVNYFPKNKLMIGMKEGEVKSSIWTDKSGAVVIKINKITMGEKISYADWLKGKINASVKSNTSAINNL